MLNTKERFKMNKNQIITGLIEMNTGSANLIKATTKNGGGLLRVNEDNSFSKIMLRRSKNYRYDNVPDEERILFELLSWFRFSDKTIKEFEYVIFAIFDEKNDENGTEDKIYPLIFKVSEIQSYLEQEGVAGENISIYIRKKINKPEFVITRLGKELENEIDVTNHYENWGILSHF